MALAAQMRASAAPPPTYCALGSPLYMGNALDYLVGHCVAVIPFQVLQSHLASCMRDVAHQEEQVRSIQEYVKLATLVEWCPGGDTQDAEQDPTYNLPHPQPGMTPTGLTLPSTPLRTPRSSNPTKVR